MPLSQALLQDLTMTLAEMTVPLGYFDFSYSDKHALQNTIHADKYSVRNTGYSDKHSAQSTNYTNKHLSA